MTHPPHPYRLAEPSVLPWLAEATPALVAQARRAPLAFARVPPRAAWLRALSLQGLGAWLGQDTAPFASAA